MNNLLAAFQASVTSASLRAIKDRNKGSFTYQPAIEVRMPKNTPYRKLMISLHLLAAAVEHATEDKEGWIVRVEGSDIKTIDGNVAKGYVHLELLHGTDAEAKRAFAMLSKVVETAFH
jgi:hypothetical protein